MDTQTIQSIKKRKVVPMLQDNALNDDVINDDLATNKKKMWTHL